MEKIICLGIVAVVLVYAAYSLFDLMKNGVDDIMR